MKKFIIPIMIVAIFVAFYQQRTTQPNVIVTVICVAVFMLGMMKLSSKIPPKDNEDDSEKI
jgi:predicted branched-subunit amino acid permease